MKKLVLAGLMSIVVGLAAVPAAATSTHGCGRMGTAVGVIRATNIGCATARKVVRADLRGKRYGAFRCKSQRYTGGATVTCKTRGRKVTFQIAD